MRWRSPETRKEPGIAEAFEPFVAFTLGYAASVPPLRSRERPEIVWLDVHHSESNTKALLSSAAIRQWDYGSGPPIGG
jgi:hypothetical protein